MVSQKENEQLTWSDLRIGSIILNSVDKSPRIVTSCELLRVDRAGGDGFKPLRERSIYGFSEFAGRYREWFIERHSFKERYKVLIL